MLPTVNAIVADENGDEINKDYVEEGDEKDEVEEEKDEVEGEKDNKANEQKDGGRWERGGATKRSDEQNK